MKLWHYCPVHSAATNLLQPVTKLTMPLPQLFPELPLWLRSGYRRDEHSSLNICYFKSTVLSCAEEVSAVCTKQKSKRSSNKKKKSTFRHSVLVTKAVCDAAGWMCWITQVIDDR